MKNQLFTPTLSLNNKKDRDRETFIGITNCYLSPTNQLLTDMILEQWELWPKHALSVESWYTFLYKLSLVSFWPDILKPGSYTHWNCYCSRKVWIQPTQEGYVIGRELLIDPIKYKFWKNHWILMKYFILKNHWETRTWSNGIDKVSHSIT